MSAFVAFYTHMCTTVLLICDVRVFHLFFDIRVWIVAKEGEDVSGYWVEGRE